MKRDLALSLAGMTVFAAVAAFGACSTTAEIAPAPTADAAPETASDATFDDATPETSLEDVYEDLSFDFATDVAWDAGPFTTPDAPAPVVACGLDGGDGGECPLPASTCVDDRWLESYINGTCVDGTCKWWRVYHDCNEGGGSFCSGGRCQSAIVK